MSDPKAYLLDELMFERLKRIKDRLYDDKPLSGDQRRDLANTLDAVMHSFQPLLDERDATKLVCGPREIQAGLKR
jgi:hypothetical protein